MGVGVGLCLLSGRVIVFDISGSVIVFGISGSVGGDRIEEVDSGVIVVVVGVGICCLLSGDNECSSLISSSFLFTLNDIAIWSKAERYKS